MVPKADQASTRKLRAILGIGHEVSMRGIGISLAEALRRTGYTSLRANFGPRDLLPLIRSEPNLCEQWAAYSEDKRTSGGWYLLRSGHVGTLSGGSLAFESLDAAVAEYVVRELDFWTNPSSAG